MRRPQGYATFSHPDAPLVEFDTITCAHCGAVVFIKPNTLATVYLLQHLTPTGLIVWTEAPGAGCHLCGGAPICLPCHDRGTCRPLERWLDEQEGTKRADQVTVGGFR